MGINRSGYYKWLKREGTMNRYETWRHQLQPWIEAIHQQHKTYGYRSIAARLRTLQGVYVSDLLVHRITKHYGYQSVTKRHRYRRPSREHHVIPNHIQNQWNATKPLEIVVSDMTMIRHMGKQVEWVFVLDTFNNEIIASALASRPGDPRPYFECLDQLHHKRKGIHRPTMLHTDQGAVYSSRAFQQALIDYNITPSMSRVGTPTDNPIIEEVNGWVKGELYTDWKIQKQPQPEEVIQRYIDYFNHQRPAYALQYKTPIQFKWDQGFI
jgi:transposase InsO family protein